MAAFHRQLYAYVAHKFTNDALQDKEAATVARRRVPSQASRDSLNRFLPFGQLLDQLLWSYGEFGHVDIGLRSRPLPIRVFSPLHMTYISYLSNDIPEEDGSAFGDRDRYLIDQASSLEKLVIPIGINQLDSNRWKLLLAYCRQLRYLKVSTGQIEVWLFLSKLYHEYLFELRYLNSLMILSEVQEEEIFEGYPANVPRAQRAIAYLLHRFEPHLKMLKINYPNLVAAIKWPDFTKLQSFQMSINDITQLTTIWKHLPKATLTSVHLMLYDDDESSQKMVLQVMEYLPALKHFAVEALVWSSRYKAMNRLKLAAEKLSSRLERRREPALEYLFLNWVNPEDFLFYICPFFGGSVVKLMLILHGPLEKLCVNNYTSLRMLFLSVYFFNADTLRLRPPGGLFAEEGIYSNRVQVLTIIGLSLASKHLLDLICTAFPKLLELNLELEREVPVTDEDLVTSLAKLGSLQIFRFTDNNTKPPLLQTISRFLDRAEMGRTKMTLRVPLDQAAIEQLDGDLVKRALASKYLQLF